MNPFLKRLKRQYLIVALMEQFAVDLQRHFLFYTLKYLFQKTKILHLMKIQLSIKYE